MNDFEPFMIVGDTHGKYLDIPAWESAMKFMKEFKPVHRIHLGDLWDLRNLRRGADPKDEADDIGADWTMGYRIIDDFRPTSFLSGNHDHRLWNLLDDPKGVVRQYARQGVDQVMNILKQLKCDFYPYDARLGVMKFGKLKIIHGYHTGLAACRNHAIVYGNCVFGHVHSIDIQSIPGLEDRESRSIGALCVLDQDYCHAKTGKLRWRHGFAYGFINKRTGNYELFQAKKVDGKWFLPTKFVKV